MIVRTLIGLLTVLSLTSAHAATSTCTSETALKQAGWTVHPSSQFARLESEQAKVLSRDQQDFVLDMKSRMMSKASQRPVEITSWDRLSTSQEIMFGDVLTILDLETGRNSELRWFDGSTKHVVYNAEFQKCAMDMVPFATNALF